jgi:oligopeptide/dipeptide ABC transporter ATP-binding protein
VVRYLADRIGVMYLGRVVEEGPAAELLAAPSHPYTRALLAARPDVDGTTERRVLVRGDPPSLTDPPAGCPFNPRCWLRHELGEPAACVELVPVPQPSAAHLSRSVACHFADQVSPVPTKEVSP